MEQAQPDRHMSVAERDIVQVEASLEPLVPKFMANRRKETAAMREALAAQDLDAVRRISHGMKGAGGSYGFDRITDFAAVIEQAAKSADVVMLERTLPLLEAYLDRVEVLYV